MSDATQQSQTIFVLCAPDRHILTSLITNIPQQIGEQGRPATVLLYGVFSKQRNGFLVIRADQGVPPVMIERLREGRNNNDILDFVIYESNPQQEAEA